MLGLAVRGCDWGWEIEMEGRKEYCLAGLLG